MTSSFLALAKIGVSLYNNNRCFVQGYKDVFTVQKYRSYSKRKRGKIDEQKRSTRD